jgi:GT2 family glycosyltransferase
MVNPYHRAVYSVIVPTLPSVGRLPRTLVGLSRQDLDPASVEVIVVADGSEHGSEGPVPLPTMPFDVRVVRQPRGGQAAARNRGAAEAGGQTLVFVDDDMELGPDFLRRLTTCVDEGADVALAVLRIGAWVPDTLPVREARLQEREAEAAYQGDTTVGFEDMIFAAVAIRRGWFERAGGFDASFTARGAYGNEDIDLGYRLLTAGADVRRASHVVAYTDHPSELEPLLARARAVGRNDVVLVRKHPELAKVVFGYKLVRSRLHRLIGSAVLRIPVLGASTMPLSWTVGRYVHEGPDGPVRFRLWFALRAMWYWRGVAEAGGRAIAREGRVAAEHELAAG